MQVQVIGKPLKYGKREYKAGEPVEMTRKHARLFIALRRVKVPDVARTDIPAAPSVPVSIVEHAEDVPETEGYERTDMEAEISPRTGRPKRQYRRRDMQAAD